MDPTNAGSIQAFNNMCCNGVACGQQKLHTTPPPLPLLQSKKNTTH